MVEDETRILSQPLAVSTYNAIARHRFVGDHRVDAGGGCSDALDGELC